MWKDKDKIECGKTKIKYEKKGGINKREMV
jgi:hypothetical protein